PRPMKKTSFFIGKAFACYIVCGVIMILYYLVSILMVYINGATVNTTVLTSLGLALLFMLGTGGFAFLMSSILKKGSTAVIVTIAALFMIFGLIDMMYENFIGEPTFSITYAASNIISAVYSLSGSMFGITSMSVLGSATVMMAWFAVTMTISALIFRRREF
ncbi:MAG: hypothetical protein FWD81_02965, partial [Methanomassiliicoccaceae archaeon]|nr:hypothetical protein [Methanomassiliicoccaceae archaeon]